MSEKAEASPSCRVYWGTHGCDFERGHRGDHACDCCECGFHPRFYLWGLWIRLTGCVAKRPYYGPDTRFYGEDAA